jgi:hypothetical protein
VLDPHSEVAGGPKVLLDVEARIDDGGNTRVLVADQVARTAEVVVNELPEDHLPTLRLDPTHVTSLLETRWLTNWLANEFLGGM